MVPNGSEWKKSPMISTFRSAQSHPVYPQKENQTWGEFLLFTFICIYLCVPVACVSLFILVYACTCGYTCMSVHMHAVNARFLPQLLFYLSCLLVWGRVSHCAWTSPMGLVGWLVSSRYVPLSQVWGWQMCTGVAGSHLVAGDLNLSPRACMVNTSVWIHLQLPPLSI